MNGDVSINSLLTSDLVMFVYAVLCYIPRSFYLAHSTLMKYFLAEICQNMRFSKSTPF